MVHDPILVPKQKEEVKQKFKRVIFLENRWEQGKARKPFFSYLPPFLPYMLSSEDMTLELNKQPATMRGDIVATLNMIGKKENA